MGNDAPKTTGKTEKTPDQLSSSYALSQETIEVYRRNGYALLPSIASSVEVEHFRSSIVSAVKADNTETRALQERDTYGKAFLQTMNLWTRHPDVARFTLARRFAKAAADLMGVAGVRIYQDQALFKEGGGGYTPMHQDHYYWPLDTGSMTTMWMPLVDLPDSVGGLVFAEGSHREGYLGEFPISDRSEEEYRRLIRERGFEVHAVGAMRAGDATFHSGWTLHGAPSNPTTMMREAMTVIYFADGARLRPMKHQEAEVNYLFAGLQPGDLAAGALHPLVYHSGQPEC